MENQLINNTNLSDFQLILFGIGCVFWAFTYIIYIQHIRKNKFIEIPIIVVAFNIAWEFVWSFLFGDSVGAYLGNLMMWGYMLWFFFDCYIFWGALKYGGEQMKNDFWKNNVKIYLPIIAISSAILFYGFKISGYDNEIGTISAYIDNIAISGFYIVLFVGSNHKEKFSKYVAWFKMLGTGLISLALVLHWIENVFLIIITSIVLILDIIYLIILNRNQKN